MAKGGSPSVEPEEEDEMPPLVIPVPRGGDGEGVALGRRPKVGISLPSAPTRSPFMSRASRRADRFDRTRQSSMRRSTIATQAIAQVMASRNMVGFAEEDDELPAPARSEGQVSLVDMVSSPRKPRVLHPFSTQRLSWDLGLVLLILTASFATPVRAAFMPLSHLWETGWYVWDRFNDAVFMIDILLNFRTGAMLKNGRVEMDPWRIAQEYARNNLALDIFAAFPYDLAGLTRYMGAWTLLPRLVRGIGLGNVIQRSGVVFIVPRSTRVVTKFAFVTTIVAHWFSALWYVIGAYTLANIDTYGESWVAEAGMEKAGPGELYVASLFWAFSQITPGTGTGGIVPTNAPERGFAILVMTTGACVYTFGITTVVQAITNRNKAQLRMHNRIDELNSYLERNHLPLEIRHQLREWFRYYGQSNLMFDDHEVLGGVSPSLQKMALLAAHGEQIIKVPFFQNVPEDAIVDVLWRLKPQLFVPNEVIFKEGDYGDCMYLVKQGAVRVTIAALGQVAMLYAGMFFGEMALVEDEGSRRRMATITTTSYALLQKLTAVDVEEVGKRYPQVTEQIERVANERRLAARSSHANISRNASEAELELAGLQGGQHGRHRGNTSNLQATELLPIGAEIVDTARSQPREEAHHAGEAGDGPSAREGSDSGNLTVDSFRGGRVRVSEDGGRLTRSPAPTASAAASRAAPVGES